MYWKLYIPILLSALIVLVQSASYIEVDENGDEYEVKRFHIQGRQLNDTNPTCVITRRKRATVPQYGVDPVDESYEGQKDENDEEEVDDNEDEDESQDTVHPIQQSVLLDEFTAANATNTKTEVDEKVESTTAKPIVEETTKDKAQNLNNAASKKPIKNTLQKVTLILPQKSQAQEEEEEQNEEAEAPEQQQVVVLPQQSIQLLQSSYLGNSHGQHYVLAGAQNQQTSGVSDMSQFFNIMPTDADYEVPFSFTYEVNPASTSAIWSTGDDVQGARQDQSEVVEYTSTPVSSPDAESPDMEEVIVTSNGEEEIILPETNGEEEVIPIAAVETSTAQPVTKPRPTKKIIKKRPNKKKRKKNSRKKNKNKRRPIKHKKRRRRPYRPVMRRKPSSTTTKRPAYNRRRPTDQHKKRTSVSRPAQGIRAQKRKRPKKNKKQPSAFTSTVSTTSTSDDNDSNIECIIINKPSTTSTSSTSTTTTTTTRRPFWNILGRNSDTVGQPREYGKRKRVALRFAN